MLKLINTVLPAACFALFGLAAFAQAQTLEIADPELRKLRRFFQTLRRQLGQLSLIIRQSA